MKPGYFKPFLHSIAFLFLLPISGYAQKLSSLLVDGATLYAGTETGICKITENGAVWKQSNFSSGYGSTVTCLAKNGNVMIAGTDDAGAFRSEDEGQTWKPISRTTFANEGHIYTIAFDGNDVYISVSHANYLQGLVYRSKDNGLSWENISDAFKKVSITAFLAKDGILYAGGVVNGKYVTTIFVSNDKGLTWKKIPKPPTGTLCSIMVPHGSDILCGTTGSFLNDGIFRINGSDQSCSLLYLYASNAIAVNGMDIFIGNKKEGVRVSHDNGATWKQSYKGLLVWKEDGIEIKSLAICNSIVYAVCWGDLYESTDNGENWLKNKGELKLEEMNQLAYQKESATKDSASSWVNRIKYNANLTVKYFLAGDAEIIYGNYEEALTKYNKALEIQPDFVPALQGRAHCYQLLKRPEDAKKDSLKALLPLPPADKARKLFEEECVLQKKEISNEYNYDHFYCYYKDDYGLFKWGKEYMGKNQYAAAEECFLKAIAINGQVAEYHLNCGIAKARQHKLNASDHFEAATQLNPGMQKEYWADNYYVCDECKGKGTYWTGPIESTSKTSGGTLIMDANGQTSGRAYTTTTTTTGGEKPCWKCEGTGKIKNY